MTQTSAPGAATAGDAAGHAAHANKHLPVMVLGALGVVYGDIGTSPIYAFRQAFAARGAPGELTQDVLGLLSLIVWALTITVSIKYVFIVTRADIDRIVARLAESIDAAIASVAVSRPVTA
mgnify:CR=1 FL=1